MSISHKRHHNRRIKAKFRRIQESRSMFPATEKGAGIFANHGKSNCGALTGNPRRYRGELTLQEISHRDDINEGLAEIESD